MSTEWLAMPNYFVARCYGTCRLRALSLVPILELLQGEGSHGLASGFRLEGARLLCERVDAFTRRSCWHILQLQIQDPRKPSCSNSKSKHTHSTTSQLLHDIGVSDCNGSSAIAVSLTEAFFSNPPSVDVYAKRMYERMYDS